MELSPREEIRKFQSMSAELYLDDSEIGQFERAATCTAWFVLSWACWQVLE